MANTITHTLTHKDAQRLVFERVGGVTSRHNIMQHHDYYIFLFCAEQLPTFLPIFCTVLDLFHGHSIRASRIRTRDGKGTLFSRRLALRSQPWRASGGGMFYVRSKNV